MENTTKIILALSGITLTGLSIYRYNKYYKPIRANKILDNLKNYEYNKKPIDFTKGVDFYYDKKANILRLKNNEDSKDFIFVNNQKITYLLTN